MGSVFSSARDGIASVGEKASAVLNGVPGASDSSATSTFGTAPEPYGSTMPGGRKRRRGGRKTRRHRR